VTTGDWRVVPDDKFGGGVRFRLDTPGFALDLYMDGPEWCVRWEFSGHQPDHAWGHKCRLEDVVAWAPELRDEAIGMTRAALVAERERLAASLSAGLNALAAGDDERVSEVLDDLRTWGTRDLREELAAVGAEGTER